MISLPHDAQLIELCEALSASGGAGPEGARPIRHPLLDDALPARVRRKRAITLRTTDENGNLAPWYHTHDDVPERVDPRRSTAPPTSSSALARLIDRDAGRSPAPPRPRRRRPPPGACKDQVVEESTADAEILWAPTPEMVERSPLTRYIRWLADEPRPPLRRLPRPLALVGDRDRGVLGPRSGSTSRSSPTGPMSEVLRRARDARAPDWFDGTRLNYAEHIFRGKADDEVAVRLRLRAARADRAQLGRAARAGRRRVREGLRALGVGAGRPRRRLPAERPRGPRRLPRHRQPRRRSGRAARPTSAPGSVVDRFAQIEPKVLFARRRLPLRRQGLRPPGRRRRGGRRRSPASSAPSSSPT